MILSEQVFWAKKPVVGCCLPNGLERWIDLFEPLGKTCFKIHPFAQKPFGLGKTTLQRAAFAQTHCIPTNALGRAPLWRYRFAQNAKADKILGQSGFFQLPFCPIGFSVLSPNRSIGQTGFKRRPIYPIARRTKKTHHT